MNLQNILVFETFETICTRVAWNHIIQLAHSSKLVIFALMISETPGAFKSLFAIITHMANHRRFTVMVFDMNSQVGFVFQHFVAIGAGEAALKVWKRRRLFINSDNFDAKEEQFAWVALVLHFFYDTGICDLPGYWLTCSFFHIQGNHGTSLKHGSASDADLGFVIFSESISMFCGAMEIQGASWFTNLATNITLLLRPHWNERDKRQMGFISRKKSIHFIHFHFQINFQRSQKVFRLLSMFSVPMNIQTRLTAIHSPTQVTREVG